MAKRTIDEIAVKNRRVLMRVDFNVPLENGAITDDRRIASALESIRSVVDRNGMLILMSHLGRPKGQREPGSSLRPVAERLEKLIARPVGFTEDCIGAERDRAVQAMRPGDVLLLENLRFHAAETLIDKARKNSGGVPTDRQLGEIRGFATGLATHADLFCNNAFGTCHRKHVSMYDVPLLLGPGKRVCGHLVRKELRFLGEALQKPERPFVAILGGAKVSDKISVIEHLLSKADSVLIAGAMSFTFFAARGASVGRSLCERDALHLARRLLDRAGEKLHLPLDTVCAAKIERGAATSISTVDIDDDLIGLDIGPATVKAYRDTIATARTIVWNGPAGVFETPPFDQGTVALARAVAEATGNGATTIIGGGDTAAAVEAAGLADRMTHISTGGGASLEFLQGRPFDTIELLDEA